MTKVVEDLLLGTELLHDHTPELDLRYVNHGTDGEGTEDLNYIALDTSYSITGTEPVGQMFWESEKSVPTVKTSANTSLDLGVETRYYGKASGDITNGQVIQFAGQQGDHILFKVAVPAEIIANPMLIMGIATEDISNGGFGFVTKFGEVTMNTTGWSAEDLLWWDNTTGQLTNVEPSAPDRRVLIATVQKEETSPAAANGILLVRISWGTKVEELENVNGTTPVQGSLLIYDGSGEYWDAGNTISVPTATSNALVLKTTDDDTTKNLLEVQDSSGTVLSAITATGRIVMDSTDLDARYLKLDTSNTGDITVNRDVNGVITSVEFGDREVTFTRTDDYVSSYTDGVHTWTISRNASNQVTGISITEN